jgi:hypothetical protein
MLESTVEESAEPSSTLPPGVPEPPQDAASKHSLPSTTPTMAIRLPTMRGVYAIVEERLVQLCIVSSGHETTSLDGVQTIKRMTHSLHTSDDCPSGACRSTVYDERFGRHWRDGFSSRACWSTFRGSDFEADTPHRHAMPSRWLTRSGRECR